MIIRSEILRRSLGFASEFISFLSKPDKNSRATTRLSIAVTLTDITRAVLQTQMDEKQRASVQRTATILQDIIVNLTRLDNEERSRPITQVELALDYHINSYINLFINSYINSALIPTHTVNIVCMRVHASSPARIFISNLLYNIVQEELIAQGKWASFPVVKSCVDKCQESWDSALTKVTNERDSIHDISRDITLLLVSPSDFFIQPRSTSSVISNTYISLLT